MYTSFVIRYNNIYTIQLEMKTTKRYISVIQSLTTYSVYELYLSTSSKGKGCRMPTVASDQLYTASIVFDGARACYISLVLILFPSSQPITFFRLHFSRNVFDHQCTHTTNTGLSCMRARARSRGRKQGETQESDRKAAGEI